MVLLNLNFCVFQTPFLLLLASYLFLNSFFIFISCICLCNSLISQLLFSSEASLSSRRSSMWMNLSASTRLRLSALALAAWECASAASGARSEHCGVYDGLYELSSSSNSLAAAALPLVFFGHLWLFTGLTGFSSYGLIFLSPPLAGLSKLSCWTNINSSMALSHLSMYSPFNSIYLCILLWYFLALKSLVSTVLSTCTFLALPSARSLRVCYLSITSSSLSLSE